MKTVDEIDPMQPKIPKHVLDDLARRLADEIDAQIVKELLAQ